jgi:hypothetical protein
MIQFVSLMARLDNLRARHFASCKALDAVGGVLR